MSSIYMWPPKLASFAKVISRVAAHYRAWFASPDGRAVLIDLAPFCFANASTRTEREAGRREVWLRISQMMNLSEEDLTVLFARLSPEARHQLWHPSSTYIEE